MRELCSAIYTKNGGYVTHSLLATRYLLHGSNQTKLINHSLSRYVIKTRKNSYVVHYKRKLLFL